MVGEPAARRVVVYVPGFNTPLGPWEAAKCRLVAAALEAMVVVTEIPGMSRFGDRIPPAIRADMMRGQVESWAELTASYHRKALALLGRREFEEVILLGYSTGCSLAVAGHPDLARLGPLRRIILIEPVATVPRNLVQLERDNMLEVLRQPGSYRTNWTHDWVMDARRRQLREPWVRYGPADLMAIATVLSRPTLPRHLPEDVAVQVDLVRGVRSTLSADRPFSELDGSLEQRGVGGMSVRVDGFGHPLWHSFPVLFPLVEALSGVVDQQPGGNTSRPSAERAPMTIRDTTPSVNR